jgi:hypothetical protein
MRLTVRMCGAAAVQGGYIRMRSLSHVRANLWACVRQSSSIQTPHRRFRSYDERKAAE